MVGAENGGRPVGVLGLSFSGGLALVAAADPEYQQDFGLCLRWGRRMRWAASRQYYLTGEDVRPDGTVERLAAA